MTERRRPPRTSPVWVFGSAAAAFVAALGLLAAQVRAGRDTALGAGTPVAVERPRPVLVRRVVRTTVVTHVVGGDAPAISRPPRTTTSSPPPTNAAPPTAPAAVTTQAS